MRYPRVYGLLLGLLIPCVGVYYTSAVDIDIVFNNLFCWQSLVFYTIALLLDMVDTVPDEPVGNQPLPPAKKT